MVNIYNFTHDHIPDQVNLLNDIDDALKNVDIEFLMFLGDFNTCLDPLKDRVNTIPYYDSRYNEKLLEFLEKYNLLDIWRLQNLETKRFTFHRWGTSTRLDYIFIENQIENIVKKVEIRLGIQSDHSTLYIEIGEDGPPRGPGMWRFNASLLHNVEFVDAIKAIFNDSSYLSDNTNPAAAWEFVKFKVKNLSIHFGSKIKKERGAFRDNLENELLDLQILKDLDINVDMEWISTKRELAEIDRAAAYASSIRSKINWAVHGDKPTIF